MWVAYIELHKQEIKTTAISNLKSQNTIIVIHI